MEGQASVRAAWHGVSRPIATALYLDFDVSIFFYLYLSLARACHNGALMRYGLLSSSPAVRFVPSARRCLPAKALQVDWKRSPVRCRGRALVPRPGTWGAALAERGCVARPWAAHGLPPRARRHQVGVPGPGRPVRLRRPAPPGRSGRPQRGRLGCSWGRRSNPRSVPGGLGLSGRLTPIRCTWLHG